VSHIAQVGVDGIVIGSSYVLVALGFTLIFGVLGIMNVAHADFYMLGALLGLWVNATTPLGSVLWIIAAVALGAFFGGLLYVTVLRHLGQEHALAVFIATLGVSFFIEYLIARILGSQARALPGLFRSRLHEIAGVRISDAQILLLGATVAITVALLVWMRYTSSGRSLRAVAENRVLAEAAGVDTTAVTLTAVIVASAVAALGGVLVSNTTLTISPFSADEVALKMMVVTIVAGPGSATVAAVAGFMLGIVESASVAYLGSQWQNPVGLVVLCVLLLLRPQGLFGRTTRVG
jgi:branched-chain amino acid transport system permease protein